MNEITSFVKDLGFPIFVAVYMLLQNTKQMKEFTTVLGELKVAIIELKDQK